MRVQSSQIRSHRDLIVWQKSIKFVVYVYKLTKPFPREETYGLTNQIRRAAASIPANIAEGQGRQLSGEYEHFLGIARGSLWELDTHVEVAFKIGYLTESQYCECREKLDEIGRILNGLLRSLQS
jgi:four helix bundle protein